MLFGGIYEHLKTWMISQDIVTIVNVLVCIHADIVFLFLLHVCLCVCMSVCIGLRDL